MTQLIECVPNFSEGRDPNIIDAIKNAISSVSGVQILDVKPGMADNRTVFTFVGTPSAVVDAAFFGIKAAQELIDMSKHSGEHPRMGATDVCPLIPVRGISIEECSEWAIKLATRVGDELDIPVYLYEASARSPERTRLPDIRRGEYEGLQSKMADKDWKPDFGPQDYNSSVATSGATVIGARPFLIAWNVNLSTLNQRKAEKIASRIREMGYVNRDSFGNPLKDTDGNTIKTPGLFKKINAIGWTIDEYGCCQISINITDHHVSPIHEVYDAIRKLALEEGVVVTGSELVGLIPEEALYNAGIYYLQKAGENPGRTHDDVIEVAIRSLGLRDLSSFDPQKGILEKQLTDVGPLVSLSTKGFVDVLSSIAPAPGGGSTAALAGALSCGLSAMVAQLSTKPSKKSWPYGTDRPKDWEKYDILGQEAQNEKEAFLVDIDADSSAFDAIMDAMRLPKSTEDQKIARQNALQQATIGAIEVPMRSLKRARKAVVFASIAITGNQNALSDAGVAASMARSCAEGAWMNVRINLKDLKNDELRQKYAEEADTLLAEIRSQTKRILDIVEEKLR